MNNSEVSNKTGPLARAWEEPSNNRAHCAADANDTITDGDAPSRMCPSTSARTAANLRSFWLRVAVASTTVLVQRSYPCVNGKKHRQFQWHSSPEPWLQCRCPPETSRHGRAADGPGGPHLHVSSQRSKVPPKVVGGYYPMYENGLVSIDSQGESSCVWDEREGENGSR